MESLPDVPTLNDLGILFGNVVSILLGLAGVTLFIMLLMGGFKYITAGGDPKAVEGAKKTLTYAIGGMVFIAISYLILVIIGKFTGANNILNFEVFKTP